MGDIKCILRANQRQNIPHVVWCCNPPPKKKRFESGRGEFLIIQLSVAATFPHLSDAPSCSCIYGGGAIRWQMQLSQPIPRWDAAPHVHDTTRVLATTLQLRDRSVCVLSMKARLELLRVQTREITLEPSLSSSHRYYLEPQGLRCHGFCRYGYKQLCRCGGRRRRSREEGWEQCGP